MELIYCASGNPRFRTIAVEAGFHYGAQLPGTTYGPLYFADQDWLRPKRQAAKLATLLWQQGLAPATIQTAHRAAYRVALETARRRYMARLALERPALATVLDWETPAQLPLVLAWAEEAAAYVGTVLIVPKVPGGVRRLPRRINGADLALAYSVASGYGATGVDGREFAGWRVHLLGGAPEAQIRVWRELRALGAWPDSADGNYAQKMATQYCQFWQPGTARYAKNRYWPTLLAADGQRWGGDGPYEAFRRSCESIMAAWQQLTPVTLQQEGKAA